MPTAARGCGFAGCNSLMSLFPSHGGAYQELSHVPIEPWWETNPATTPRQELGMVSPELTPAISSTAVASSRGDVNYYSSAANRLRSETVCVSPCRSKAARYASTVLGGLLSRERTILTASQTTAS